MIDDRLNLRTRRIAVRPFENEELQIDRLTDLRFEHELIAQRTRDSRVRMRNIIVDAGTHLPLVLQGGESRRFEIEFRHEIIRSKRFENQI